MSKPWNEVAGSEAFKALTPDQQDGARRQYFDDVVAPKVPDEHKSLAWDQFSREVGVGRRALPTGVAPSTAGAGRGAMVPPRLDQAPPVAKPIEPALETIYDPVSGLPLGTQEAQVVDGRTVDERRTRAPGRLTDADIPAATVGSVARDVASGVLQIGPTAVKGVGELARLATGDRIGKGLADSMDRGNEAIQDTVGSERGGLQRKKFAQDMQDPALNAADVIFGNPGAMADQVLPTAGSMALPIGAAGAAGKVATSGRAAQLARAIDEATVVARANKARQAAVAATTVAQNSAGTFSDIRDAGGELDAAYTGAAVSAPFTYVANRLTGGAAEASAANMLAGIGKGAVKEIPKAMAKEGAQEVAEEAGSYVGETVGKGEEFDANAAAKRMAVAGTLGAVMGGSVEAAGAARTAREARIKTLRDAGETAAADLLQQKNEKANAADSVEAELSAMPGNETFAQQYRTLRTAGVKPAEAAARSAVTTTFQGLALDTGVPDKALQAAMTAAQGMPLDKVPGFFQKFTEGLAKRGLIQPSDTMAAIGTSLEAARDDAMEAAISAAYKPVKPTMDAVQALEAEQEPDLVPVDIAQEATETIAPDSQSAAVDFAAHDAATSPLNDLPEPTQAQKEAGNYKVGRVNLHGLNISVENPEGSVRKGVGDDGKAWENTLAAHYGYIRGTEGNDGDHVDTFIGPNPASDKVFVVDQVNKDGSFDEHKVMLGVDSLEQADTLYHANYHEGWTGRGAITEMPMAEFKAWVKDGVKSKPLGTLASAQSSKSVPVVSKANESPDLAESEQAATNSVASDDVEQVATADGGQNVPAVHVGRDNVPLSEVGKAFKTRKAADDARKLNPLMRVVRAEGGYALTEKTPAQLAAQEKAAKRLRNPQTSARGEPIPAHAMIAAAGGLAPDTRADMGMQGNVQIGNRKLFAGEGKGLTIERATERLVEEGYLPEGASHDSARDLIKRSLAKPQYNAEGYERMAELDRMERLDAAQFDEDEAIAEIEALSDNQLDALLDADIPWDASSNTDTESAMRALGFTEQEIQDAITNQSREPQDGGASRGGLDEGTASQAQADSGSREEAPPEPQEVTPTEPPAPAGVSTSGRQFQPVTQFDKVNLGPGGYIRPRVIAAGQPTYRETDIGGLDQLMREDRYAVPFNGFVADRSELALGQGANRGVQLIFRPDSVSGREHAKPMTGDLAGREYRTDLLAPQAVQTVIMKKVDELKLRGLTRMRLKAEFDRTEIAKGKVQYSRKGLPVVAFPEAEPTVFDVTKRADGTLEVQGDPDAIREALADIPARSLSPMRGGILVGRTQADKAMAILQPEGLTAPTKEVVLAHQAHAERVAKDKVAADRSADKQARDAEDRKRIAQASEAAADSFELGGDAMANLTGQKDIFAQESATKQEPAKIKDFGEKIGGAKKDLWTGFKDDLSAVKDDEIASRKLSEIWPAPDYQKLIDGGLDAKSVAIIRALRDEIPSKPRNAYKLKRWADQVQTMRDLATNVLNRKDTGAGIAAQLEKGSGQLRGIAGRADLYMAVGHDKSLEGIRLAQHHYSLYRGRENVTLWVAERDSGATAFSNWPQELATGDTKEQAIAAFKARYAELDGIAAVKKASFDIYSQDGKFFIGKKIGRNIAEMAGPFATLKEAREHRANNLPELDAKLAKYKEIPNERRDSNEPRVGEDMRNGQDVTPEMFANSFGFKGVEFGNWVEQKRRQKDLNDAFDALMDMAAIMGVPAKAISLNGELGLAFGARGSGGVNPAAAHYEADKIVINLTKREGAGSLGHEWWHALDNYFSRMRGSKTSTFMTTATDVGLSARGSQYMAYPGVRKEMIDAFGEVVRAIKNTAVKARSSKMDAKRTKEYWTTGEEMAARAFESYLISKLHDQNASNDYLANVVDQKTWDAMAALGMENEDSYPYPTAGEMPVIRAGFDKFFQTLQAKETDKGVALYARSLGEDAFRLGITPRRFMPVSDVQKAVDQLTAKWKDGPRVKVVLSPEQLPLDAPSDARGLIHKGTAYVVAGNHLDKSGVARTLAHEAIGHYGLWKMLGTDGTRQFERNVQLALKSGNKPLNAIAAKVRELYVDESGKFNLSPAEEANEIAAFAVEEALDADGNFKPGFGFFKQVWSKVADFLRSLGIDVKFTNAELQGMLVSSMRGLETGKRLAGGNDTLVAAARDDQAELASTLLELGQNDELFQYPRSDALELRHIAEDKGNTIKVSDVDKSSDKNEVWMLANTTPKDNAAEGTKSWMLSTPQGKLATLTRKGNEVYINVSGIGEGNGGSAIYDIAANYALNNGLVFVGDPNGVSSAAMRRRLENMLSSAIKYGTTDHIKPHDDQYLGNDSLGIPPLDWTKGDTLGNIRHMVDVSIASTKFLFPNSSDHVRFDPATQSFVDAKGRGLDAASIAGILADRGRSRGLGEAGRATVQRATLYDALVQSPGARRALLGSLRGQQAGRGAGLGEGLERTFYARGVTSGLFAPTIWDTPDPTNTDKIIYELQDGRVDLKRVQQAIEKSGQQIEEKWDARLAETLYPGRVAYRSQSFLDVEVKPLLKALAAYKVPMDELADYLHARGAEERNAQIAKVNPDMPDGGAGKNSKGVLLTNQAARDYLANLTPERKQLMDVLAAKVDSITAGTRKLLVDEGLEKQDTIDAWTKTYKHYVPMFRDEAQSGAPHPQGSGFAVKGSASKRATGSTKEVTNILAHVLMQREAAITRAEKNRVALALYGQALSHPNPDFWTTIKPSMTSASIAKELVAMGVDPATAAAGMETVPTITTVDEATGKKVDRPNPLYKSLPGAIPLKVNGEDRVLMINTEKERGARLAENLKNLDGLTKLDLANTIIGKGTRWLASVNTQYNPAFGLVNLTRDTLGAVVNLGSTRLRGDSLRVLATTPVAIHGIAKELMGVGGGKWQSLYRQFQEDGGQTGFKENFRDASDRAKAIESELAGLQKAGKLTSVPGRVVHALLDLLDGFNTTLENAVRVSAYAAALDNGLSRAEAARLGRELTVDFNRKGRAGREVGPLYAFFNASVQGSARTVQALKGPTGAKIIAGGLGLGAMQALMLLAAGYDDDEVPEFVKTRALVIPLNWTGEGERKHVLVPYPLGLHVIPNTGRVISELALNGGKQLGKRSFDAIGEIAGAFNPLGGGSIFTADGALKTVAPTLVDPLIELGFNRNFAGGSIERAPFKGEADTRPGAARAKESTQRSSTGQVYIGISKALNALSGGTDYEAGSVSPTPERLRYIAQTVGGGVLREIEKTVNASTASSRGEAVKMSQIPVAGRFYGEVDSDQVTTSRYFENTVRLDKLETTKNTMVKAHNLDALAKLQSEHPELALAGLGNRVQAAVGKLNKMATSTVGDANRIKQVDANRVEVMEVLNKAMADLEKQTQKPTLADKIKGWKKEPTN